MLATSCAWPGHHFASMVGVSIEHDMLAKSCARPEHQFAGMVRVSIEHDWGPTINFILL